MGVKRFGETITKHAQEHYPKHVERGMINRGWADPAGIGKDEIFEVASFDYLAANFGIKLEPAPTQDTKLRVAAIMGPCGRLHEQVPGLIVSRQGCPILHQGLLGKWYYKRLQVAGEDRYADSPVKNDYSHPCDALAYGCLGMGEFSDLGAKNHRVVTVHLPASGPGGGAFSNWPQI
jgi:hypothetical protein